MPRLRRLSGREVLAILVRLGFEIIRVKGSHHHLRHTESGACFTTVPVHGNQPLRPGTLKAIIKQVTPCLSDSDLNSYFYSL